MRLKISTPQQLIYQGEIEKISLPTDSGNITITDKTNPMVTSIKPGIIKILPFEKEHTPGYIFSNDQILISTSKGTAFVDGQIIRIVTTTATTTPRETKEDMLKKKSELENEIRLLKTKGSIEQIESKMTILEKINADILLSENK